MDFNPIGLSGVFVIPANGEISYPFIGNYVRCLESTAAFRVAIGDDTSGMAFEKGISYDCPEESPFAEFRLINTTGAAITVTIAFGRGRITDNRLVVGNGISISDGMIQPVGGQSNGDTINGTTSATPNTAGTAINASPDTRGWTITNTSTTDTFWIGYVSSTTVANGTPVGPGEKFSGDHRGAVRIVSNVASVPYRVLRSLV